MLVRQLFLVLMCAIAAAPVQAQNGTTEGSEITLAQVLTSTLQSHPKLFSLSAKLEEADGRRLSASGNFDWKIEYNQQSRTGGFYDGWFADQKLSRQLGWANAKLSTGYRVSDGTLPVYEQYHRTLTDGEPNLKLSLSLLKHRETDPLRQAVVQSELEYATTEQLQTLAINDLLRDAAFYYLDWQQAFLEVQVTRNLLTLAEQRNTAIEARVRSGDLARIVETEFKTTLLQRQAALLEKRQKLAASGLKLSLYRRNQAGEPLAPGVSQRPKIADSFSQRLTAQLQTLPEEMLNHPQLQALKFRREQLEQERKLASTELLPQLDMDVWVANDIGTGSETLDGLESYVGVNFSVPLERRKAKGKLQAVEAKIKALNFDQQQTQEIMRNFVTTELLDIENLTELLGLQKNQAELAIELADLEQKRFAAGDSDLFLLNAREIARAEAELTVVQTQINIMRKQINLLAEAALLLPIAS